MSVGLPSGASYQAAGVAVNGFVDNSNEYGFYANETGEKLETLQVIETHVAKLSQQFANAAQASPSVPYYHYESGLGDGETLAQVLSVVDRELKTDGVEEPAVTVVAKEFAGDHAVNGALRLADVLAAQKNLAILIENLASHRSPGLDAPPEINGKPQEEPVVINIILSGETAEEFREQIEAFRPQIEAALEHKSNKEGNAQISAHRAFIKISRADRETTLDPVPGPNTQVAYNSANLQHGYRLTGSETFKGEKLIGPIAEALKPGGELIVIQAAGDNTGAQIIKETTGQDPFTGWSPIIGATQKALGEKASEFNFLQGDRIELETDVIDPAGAFRAAVYAAQVTSADAQQALESGALEKTQAILEQNGGKVRFSNETLIVRRSGPEAALN